MSKKQIVKDTPEPTPIQQAEFIAAVSLRIQELDRGEQIPIEEVERELPSWIIK